jgi:ribosomal protein L11 methyltransferase
MYTFAVQKQNDDFMKYIHVQFNCNPNSETVKDVLAATLADIGFETFEQFEGGLNAYIPINLFSETNMKEILDDFPLGAQFSWTMEEMEEKNWNEEWERNYFQPIVIADQCCIHSSFHLPTKVYPYQILIDPKMAFGTGHHPTTGLILQNILSMELKNKTVLDMGCGTAVLAILASMRGATSILAIDIDEWACNNARENVKLNGMSNIEVKFGGAELLGDQTFDVIFANINRNILLRDMAIYDTVLNKGGQITMSGFYKEDIPYIRAEAEAQNWKYDSFQELDRWVAVTFFKLVN